MALLDLESLGSQLREIKISQLEPELLDSVLELTAEHGEITISSSTNLHFLIQIYQAEDSKENKDRDRLKKAENLILRLASIRPLQYEEQRQESHSRKDRKPAFDLMTEGGIGIGGKERALLESVGITDETEMRKAISLIGEAKIAQRVQLARSSKLGNHLTRLVFGENPSVLGMPKDEDFEIELRAMENKKDLIDKWVLTSDEPLPIWADYMESPNVLLVHYTNLYRALVLGSKDKKAEDFAAGPETEVHIIKLLREVGLSIEEKGGSFRITCPDGRGISVIRPEDVSQPKDPADKPFREEKTVPARPSALKSQAESARTRSRTSETAILFALRDMGIDISPLSAELDRLSESSDPVSRSREQKKFEGCVAHFHELLKSGRLEAGINKYAGGTALRIAKAAYMPGANGAFELLLADGTKAIQTRIYLHLQDMGPAQIGKSIAESEGLATYRIWIEKPEGAGFAISEDAREVGKRGKITLRMPDTFMFEQAETSGAAVFKEDLVLRPEPENELHAEYYEMISDYGKRKEMLGALFAYFEMSRRALLPDRRPSNTFVLRIIRADGNKAMTFQPTDLDGIGNFIDSRDGEPDFSGLNHDFQKAAVDFAIQMHEGMLRAAEKGMLKGDIPSPSEIFSELSYDKQRFPLDGRELNETREVLLRDNDGMPIGIGFDASQLDIHSIPSQGGRSMIIGKDGRVRLESARAIRTASIAGSLSAQDEFIDGFYEGGRKCLEKMPRRVAEIAVTMAENPDEERIARLRNMTGGEIAYSIYSDLPLGDRTSLFAFAESEAKKRILGLALIRAIAR